MGAFGDVWLILDVNEELLLVMKIWGLLLSGIFCLYSEALQRGLRSEGHSLPG